MPQSRPQVPGRLDLASSSEQGLRRLVYLARRAAAELQGDGSQGAAAGAVVYVAARKELLEFVRGLEELQVRGGGAGKGVQGRPRQQGGLGSEAGIGALGRQQGWGGLWVWRCDLWSNGHTAIIAHHVV